jgi:hypothetical protein
MTVFIFVYFRGTILRHLIAWCLCASIIQQMNAQRFPSAFKHESGQSTRHAKSRAPGTRHFEAGTLI